MTIIEMIGLLAAVGTTTSFLPQVIKSWRTGKTQDLSLLMYTINAGGTSLWLFYGLLIKDFPLILANGITLSLILSILFLKIRNG